MMVNKMINKMNAVLDNNAALDAKVEDIRNIANAARHNNVFDADFEKKAFDRIIAAVDNQDNQALDILHAVENACYDYFDDNVDHMMQFVY